MNKPPAFQFYANDWLSSPAIMLMTPAQEGAYIRLLALSWQMGGLPDDDEQLASLSRLGKGWLGGASTIIRQQFVERGGKLVNKRLESERKKQRNWREKSRQGGVASGKSRRDKGLGRENASRVVEPPLQPNGNSSTPTTNATPSPSLIEIEKESLDQEGLGLEKKLKVGALRFIDGLDAIFPRISQDEATTFSRIAQHFQDQIRTGQKELAIFDTALEWARDAMSRNAKSPKGLFVAKVKEATGFTGKGLLLNQGQG